MLQVDIPASIRTVFGKGESRRLRMDEKTPAVVYSSGDDSLALQFETSKLYKELFALHGRNAVVTLDIDGDDKDNRHVLIKDIQVHPVTDRLIHVDFQEISLDAHREFKVPINYTGVAKGVDLGGELHVAQNIVRIKGCPLDIPDNITVDVTPLDKGEAGVTFGDLPVSDAVEILDNKSALCVNVI